MNKQERINLLRDLVKIDSVGGHEKGVSTYLANFLDHHGIKNKTIEVEPGRYNLVAEIGDKPDPVLVLEGHQDVVGLGDRSKWTHDPLEAEIVGNRMYGRGTSDMKAGLAAEIITMVELKDSRQQINGQVRLLATVGEESSSVNHMQGAQYFAQNGYLDHVTGAIVAEPSSVPVSWLEGGPSQIPFKFEEKLIDHLIHVNQSSEQYLLSFAHKGSITYEIRSKGKSAHSSSPNLGINAIDPLIEVYEAQKKYFLTLTKTNTALGKTVPVVTKIIGGDQLNSVPGSASLYVKIRTIPEEKNDDIVSKIRDIVDQLNNKSQADLSFHLLGNKYPVMSNPNDKLIQSLKRIGEAKLNQEVPIGGTPGGTDAAEFVRVKPDIAVAVFGPGNLTAHQIDEFVDLDNFERFITIYEEVIKAYF